MRSLTVARAAVCTVSSALLIWFFLHAHNESIHPSNWRVVYYSAWWLSPLVYYWRVRTVAGAYLVGAVLIGLAAYLLSYVYGLNAPTASALGLATNPLVLWIAAVILVETERAAARRVTRHKAAKLPGS